MSGRVPSLRGLFLAGLLGAGAGAAVFLFSWKLGAGLILSLILGGVGDLGLTGVLVLPKIAGRRGEGTPGPR